MTENTPLLKQKCDVPRYNAASKTNGEVEGKEEEAPACQLLLIIILLGWPLSLLIMGLKFMSQCPMNSFLPNAMVEIGLLGITALLLRLVLASIEKWYWFPMQTVISSLWNALKFLEFVFLLVLIIQLWFFFGDSPSFDSKDPNFCNETFYSFMFWMKRISTALAVVWLAAYFVKAVFWVMRIRYHYMPLFE
ncbi:hypothetical protein AVEN_142917-1 [Araneus ventricosus]|uniref:Uncharacterized protein n=1 Tax=Araneus ventricosus TaxID=182803 RepID=A0A4Y2FN78_ARAVE|nr:hypothetical protein AVEN_142917-1 [Araneus ventricosus]